MSTTPVTTIVEVYRDMVVQFGGGFHPDTPPSDYTSLPDGFTPELVDQIQTAVREAGLDEYELALDAIQDRARPLSPGKGR